jgi:phosphoglycolate phosphatase-like HAD superfamily hydrolase
MKMVGVTHGTGDRAELEALSPYAVIDHFSELPDLIKNLIAPSVPTQNRSSAI